MAENEDPNIISKIERKKAKSKKEGMEGKIDYSKYAVGGESKEVPASSQADESDNSIKDQSKQEQKND